jgi:hypothetical protein
MITKIQKAWMAGVLETRGKIRFTNDASRKTNQLVLQLMSSHLHIAHEMARLTGTKVQSREAKLIDIAARRGCVEHCPEAHVHVNNAEVPEIAIWSISGVGAAIVLNNLVGYMVNEDNTLLTVAGNIIAALPKGGAGRAAVDKTIIRLKKLGWTIPMAALDGFVGVPATRGAGGKFVKPPELAEAA